jgi:hypothetical protein
MAIPNAMMIKIVKNSAHMKLSKLMMLFVRNMLVYSIFCLTSRVERPIRGSRRSCPISTTHHPPRDNRPFPARQFRPFRCIVRKMTSTCRMN